MDLSIDEYNVLATQHGNTREARAVRAKLSDVGLKYCPYCSVVKSLSDFPDLDERYKNARCDSCYRKSPKRSRSYIKVTTAERIAETSRLYCERHPDRVHERLRQRYRTRREAGMPSYEAAYNIPPSS